MGAMSSTGPKETEGKSQVRVIESESNLPQREGTPNGKMYLRGSGRTTVYTMEQKGEMIGTV